MKVFSQNKIWKKSNRFKDNIIEVQTTLVLEPKDKNFDKIDSKFDKFVAYNHEKLAELKLVGREDDGTPNHFVNVTGFQRLHNGAIWQQYEKHNQLLEAVYELAKEAVGEEKANSILEKHEVKRLN